MKWRQLRKAHHALKKTRHRGDPVASALATDVYLRALEDELDRVRFLLYSEEHRGRAASMDEAQQRMHRLIKKQGKKGKRK